MAVPNREADGNSMLRWQFVELFPGEYPLS